MNEFVNDKNIDKKDKNINVNNENKKKKILLGMSGGVDSSVSAILLKEQGYEVVGVTMKLFDDKNNDFSSTVKDAKKVCDKLNICHYEFDLSKEFKTYVIDNFIQTYINAKTPNPCVECNKYLKFGALYKIAKTLGIEYMATGHYANVEYDERFNAYVLKKSKSVKKDQSYVLYNISKEVLSHVVFPLNEFETKDEIRKIAFENGLDVANKPDSQEICFIPDDDYINFLKNNMSESQKKDVVKIGDIIDTSGKIRAKHSGIINYTIGQRKGLGIQNEKPLYVFKLDKEKNQVLVGENEKIYTSEAYIKDVNLLLDVLTDGLSCTTKIRYSSTNIPSKIYFTEKKDILKIVFEKEQRAVTPGQSLVIYLDDIVVGGGKII